MEWQLPCTPELLTMLAREQRRNCGVWAVPEHTLLVLLEVQAHEGGVRQVSKELRAHKHDWSQDCEEEARVDWKWGLEQMMDGVPEQEQTLDRVEEREREQTMNQERERGEQTQETMMDQECLV